MIKSINNITLRHLNGIYIQKDELKKIDNNSNFFDENRNTLSVSEFATIVKKFQGFGYTFEKDLAYIISRLDREYAILLCEEVLENIKEFKSDKNYTIFYKNFPNEVINMETADIYLNQILHYWFGYLPHEKNENPEKEDLGSEPAELFTLSHLKFAGDQEIETLFVNLLSSNITLSQQYLDDVCYLSDGFSDEELEQYCDNIQMKETLTTLASYTLKHRNFLAGNFNTATDILRLITKISNDKLNENNILNTKHIHFKYFNVRKAVDMLFGEFSFETEKGYFNKMSVNIQNLNNDELKIFITKFSKYSGDYVRNVLSLLNNASETQYEIITNGLKNCMKDVNNRILFQLYDRILNLLEKENLKNIVKKQEISEEKSKNFFKIRNIFRNTINKHENLENNEIEQENEIIPRIVNSKGTWRKLDETVFLNENLLKFLLETVKNGILENLKLKNPLEKVFIDESYKNIAITTSEKDSNISLKPMTRGSRFSFNNDAEVLRFFVGWKNIKEKRNDIRVDIDLSVICFDENFKFLKTVAYYNQVEPNFVFSGDIINAPNGALEFIDVYNLEKLKNSDIRYVLMEIRSYNGFSFEEIGSVYAGVLELTKKEAMSDQNLYSSAVTQGFQILSNTRTTNTILIDFEKNEYIWIDMNMPVSENFSSNNYLNQTDIAHLEDVLKYFVNKKYVTMYELLQLNAIARGTQVFEKENADIIFDKVDNDNPLPLNDILANYF